MTKITNLSAGIVGSGFMATVHGRALMQAGVTIAGIASRTRGGATRVAEELAVQRIYGGVEELLQTADADVIHICTPNSTHVRYAEQALLAGKHVICEKPLATGHGEAQRLRDLADERGLVLAVPFVYRFHPMVRELTHRIAVGAVGRVHSFRGSYLQDWMSSDSDHNWRADPAQGGPSRAFADIGSHLADLVEFVTADRIVRLSAVIGQAYRERSGSSVDTEDLALCVVEMASGAIGTLMVSQVAPGHKNDLSLEVMGTGGSAAFTQEMPDFLWFGYRDRAESLSRDGTVLSADASRLSIVPPGHPMGYQDAFNAFVRDTYEAVNGTIPFGLPSAEAGVRAAQLTEAVLSAAQSGQWISTQENSPLHISKKDQ